MDALPAVWLAGDSASSTADLHASGRAGDEAEEGADVGEASTLEAPSLAAERALVAWADARGIRITRPPKRAVPALAVDPTVADAVEKQLVVARDALTRLDVASTEVALARAQALLRDHPELPQAAWLLAEVERGWAARWMRISPPDSDRAARAWQRASALDGGRAAGIGEVAAPKVPDVVVRLAAEDDHAMSIYLDGSEIALGDEHVAPGEHAIVTKRRGRISWAGWVSFADQQIVRIPDLRSVPCSADDLTLARTEHGKPGIDALGVACGEWIAAAPAGNAAVRVARCEGEHCGPWVLWQSRATSLTPVLPARPPKHKASPWLIVGAAALAAVMITGVTLVAAGAFDAPPHETKFVGGGVKTSSFSIIP